MNYVKTKINIYDNNYLNQKYFRGKRLLKMKYSSQNK